jgi:LmbE family N-acetylglucosaminyl deacetylase
MTTTFPAGTSAETGGSAAASEGVERVLVVTAHPDDVDFGMAGTVATWTAAGT